MYFTNYYVPVGHTNSQVQLGDIPIIQYYRDIFTHNYRIAGTNLSDDISSPTIYLA